MDLAGFTMAQLLSFPLVLGRVAAMLFTLPLFGGQALPAQIKIGLAMVFSLTLFPLVAETLPPPPADAWGWAMGLGGEVFLGVAVGLAIRILFAAIDLAGQFVGLQMGFGVVTLIDPQSHAPTQVIAQFQNLLTVLLLLSLNLHHQMVIGLVRSFDVVPVMGVRFAPGGAELILQYGRELFVLAVRIAAPVLVALFLTNVALAILARLIPQMNVFIVSLPLTIGIGLVVLGLSLPTFLSLLQGVFGPMEGRMLGVMAAFR